MKFKNKSGKEISFDKRYCPCCRKVNHVELRNACENLSGIVLTFECTDCEFTFETFELSNDRDAKEVLRRFNGI